MSPCMCGAPDCYRCGGGPGSYPLFDDDEPAPVRAKRMHMFSVPMRDGRTVTLRPVTHEDLSVETGAPTTPGLYLAELRLPSGARMTIAPTVAMDGCGVLVYSDGDIGRIRRAIAEGRIQWVYRVEEVRR